MEMLKSTIQDMEKERDFYFGKLRNIEVICQEKEGEEDPTLLRIMDILYATDVSQTRFNISVSSSSFSLLLWFTCHLLTLSVIVCLAPTSSKSDAAWWFTLYTDRIFWLTAGWPDPQTPHCPPPLSPLTVVQL